MPKVTFVSKIIEVSANDKLQKKIITIPRDFWEEVKELQKRKQIKITIEEAYD